MSPVRPHHKYRGLRDLTMEALIEAARSVLPETVPRQTRYKVTELPTERTVRFYMSRGIVDRPAGRRGTSSLFGYRHLLQVLAVKRLQSQYLPLRKIRSLLRGRSNRELEQILTGGGGGDFLSVPPAPEAIRGTARHAPAGGVPAGSTSRRPGEGWRRHLIVPGMELHLREDFRGIGDNETLARCREHILRILEELRPDAGEGEG